jgi:glycosyltransferase involved in cell wall biosynthesis
MSLVNLPALRRKSLETLSHSFLSAIHAGFRGRPDVVLLFNAANAPVLPVLRLAGLPVAVHLDGLEWQRAKWQGLGQRYYQAAERWSVRWANEVIADARAIADHVRRSYGRESVYIPYGAPVIEPGNELLAEAGLERRGYHLVVARFEPENHVELIVRGFVASSSTSPLVVVGSAPYSDDYRQRVATAAAGDPRVRLMGSVWDQRLLDQLYANCISYLHGHSVGGTNPSLLRAMGAGAPVIAYDVVFNREVTGGHAKFFRDTSGVRRCVEASERQATGNGQADFARERALKHYVWADVAADYERLCQRLAGRS